MKLFHVTKQRNIASILTTGLQPGYRRGLTCKHKWKEEVFLTNDPERIIKEQAGKTWSERWNPIILEVDVSGLEVTPVHYRAYATYTLSDFEFIHKGRIEPKRINYYSKMKKVIIITGPPCCGKGTQSKNIAQITGYRHVSTGDLIRLSDREDLKAIIATGQLLSDQQMGELLNVEFEGKDNIILDGYPRTPSQVVILNELLAKKGYEIEAVIYLVVSNQALIERMRSRNDGRTDDNDEKFITRLDNFEKHTAPTIVNHLSKCNNFAPIDGSFSPETITQYIIEHLQIEDAY